MSLSLKDRMPYWHFDNEIMVFEDGSLGKGYKLEGFDINCTDSEKINQLSVSLEHLLTGVEEGLRTGRGAEEVRVGVATKIGPGRWLSVEDPLHPATLNEKIPTKIK